MKTIRQFISLSLAVTILSSCNQGGGPADQKQVQNTRSTSDSLIQRIVCFKFKETASQQQIEQHMRGFAGLKDSITQMLTYSAGPTVKGDLQENSEYHVMHYSTYRTQEDIKIYAVHPVHLRFIEQNKGIWDKVLVINSNVLPHEAKEHK